MIGNISVFEIFLWMTFGVSCYFMLVSPRAWFRGVGVICVILYLLAVSFFLGYHWHLCHVEPEPIKTYL